MKLYLLATTIFLSTSLFSQAEVFGQWITIDDQTGRKKSVVDIYQEQGKLFGTIKQIFPLEGEDPDPVCEKCSDARKNQKVLGMQIINDLVYEDGIWQGGEILDPENGKTYACKIWREGSKLMVRGYVAFFYRTQTWIPSQVK